MIDDDQANAANLACSAIACLVLLARLVITRYQSKTFDLSWFVALIGFVSLLARAIISFEVIRLGTASDANARLKKNPKLTFSEEARQNIRVGSTLVLVTRLFLTNALWTANILLLLLYRRFVQHLPWMKHVINGCWIFIAVSYLGTIFATFLECHPFELYWEVTPHPSSCVKAYVQTVLQCACNMLVDLVIMAISIPILFIQGSKLAQQLRIGFLISLGAFCVLTNILRLYYIFNASSNQATRTFWASINILVAHVVASAPVLYGSITIHKRRKNRSHYGEASWQYNRSGTARSGGPAMLNAEEQDDYPLSLDGHDRKDVITKHTVVAVHSDSPSKLSRMGIDDTALPSRGYTAAATSEPRLGRSNSRIRHFEV